MAHAAGFAEASGPLAPRQPALDLGSGGGLPGLVLAFTWPGSSWTLVEANRRRADFLVWATAELECSDRVDVVRERAEVVGHDPAHRATYSLVAARGFGPPAVTAECAAPLLGPDGMLVVSEPPEGDGARWVVAELGVLGLVPERIARTSAGTYQLLRQATPCPDRYPRRVGVPAKRPLF